MIYLSSFVFSILRLVRHFTLFSITFLYTNFSTRIASSVHHYLLYIIMFQSFILSTKITFHTHFYNLPIQAIRHVFFLDRCNSRYILKDLTRYVLKKMCFIITITIQNIFNLLMLLFI